MNLLTREEFRETVMKRDGYKCAVCGSNDGLVAHHIIERKLFNDGGYYVNNGVTLCPECHINAEKTLDFTCSPTDLRRRVGIINVILPEGFDKTCTFDKWGNRVLDTYLYEYNDKTIEVFKKVVEGSGAVIRFVDNKYAKDYHNVDVRSGKLMVVNFLVPFNLEKTEGLY